MDNNGIFSKIGGEIYKHNIMDNGNDIINVINKVDGVPLGTSFINKKFIGSLRETTVDSLLKLTTMLDSGEIARINSMVLKVIDGNNYTHVYLEENGITVIRSFLIKEHTCKIIKDLFLYLTEINLNNEKVA